MIKLTSLEGEPVYLDPGAIFAVVQLPEVEAKPLYEGGPMGSHHPRRTRVEYGKNQGMAIVVESADAVYDLMNPVEAFLRQSIGEQADTVNIAK